MGQARPQRIWMTRMSRRSKQLDAACQQGERLHAAGRLAEAEQMYRQVLAAEPRHADASHMLGVLALQSGHPAAALDLFDAAILVKPLVSAYHVHRAHALLALRRPAEAVVACRVALRTKSNNAEAYQVLGHAHTDALQPGEALRAYREAVRLKPNLPDLFNNLGTALRNIGALEEAEERLREALRRAPDDMGGANQSIERAEGAGQGRGCRVAVARGTWPAAEGPGAAL